MNSKKSLFPKNDYRFWKSYKALSWDQRMPLFWTWTTRLSPTEQVQSSLQPISNTSALNAKHRKFNNTVFMRKTLFPKMLSKAFIIDSKAPKTLKLSDWSFCLHSWTKKCVTVFTLHAMVLLGHKLLFLSVNVISVLNHQLVRSGIFVSHN